MIAATLVSALAAWCVARITAARRALPIGALPTPLVFGLAAAAALGSEARATPAALAALGGAAVAALVDLRTGLIFDSLTVPMLIAALVIAWFSCAPLAALCGASVAGGALAALFLVTRGRGIGLGDVKLGAALGAALGWHAGLNALGVAFVAGGAYGAVLMLAGRTKRGATIRFGPFLAAGTGAAVLFPGLLP